MATILTQNGKDEILTRTQKRKPEHKDKHDSESIAEETAKWLAKGNKIEIIPTGHHGKQYGKLSSGIVIN